MSVVIRGYTTEDYERVVALYKNGTLYGGQFDGNRDSEERLRKKVEADPDGILVAEDQGRMLGAVSLIEDGRVAWLFRFAVDKVPNEAEIAQQLCTGALEALKSKGHHQVLVYTPVGDKHLDERYEKLGFNKGKNYTCYWKDI